MDPQVSIDPSPTSPTFPTSLPGRNPTVDADASLERKRPRLTPPQNVNGNDALPEQSFESPVRIEIIAHERQNDLPTDVIVLDDDEELGRTSIDTFPWVNDQRCPEETAAIFAEICCDSESKQLHAQEIEQFASWIRKYVATMSTIPESRIYIQNHSFWFHVGRCFEGIANRRLSGALWRIGIPSTQWHHLLCDFARLYAILCSAEADYLERITSRRDSAKPASPSRTSLLFYSHISAFEKFLIRPEFVRNSDEYEVVAELQQEMAIAFIQEQKEMDAFFRLYHLIATKIDFVEFAHDALLSLTRLSLRILIAASSLTLKVSTASTPEGQEADSKETQSFRKVMASVLETTSANVIPGVLKIHPDYLPAGFHSIMIDLMTNTVGLLDPVDVPSSLRKVIDDASHYAKTVRDLDMFSMEDGLIQSIPFAEPPLGLVYKLDVLKTLIKSGVMAIRVTGVDLLGSTLFQLWKDHGQDRTPQDLHPFLQFTANYLHANDLVKYLFGSESHADLIRRSSRVVEFLSVTGNLTRSDADTLWNTCIQNQHADFGQAGFQILSNLMHTASLEEALFICRKFGCVSPLQLGRQMTTLLRDIASSLVRKAAATEAYLEVARISIALLQKVSSQWKDIEIQLLRETVSAIVTELLVASGNIDDNRSTLLDFCADDIRSCGLQATGSVHAFLDLLGCSPFDVSRARLHEILPFHEIASELCRHIQNRGDHCAKTEFWTHALVSQIRLAHVLLACGSDGQGTTTERMLWNHTIGANACDDEARNIAWQALVHDLEMFPPLYAYFRRCITIYLPTLAPCHATLGIHSAFDYSLKRRLPDRDLKFTFDNEIIRFALTTPKDEIAEAFMAVVVEAAFNIKTPCSVVSTADQQAAVVEKCIDCILTRSDGRPLRAVSLLRRILQQSITSCKIVDKADDSDKVIRVDRNGRFDEDPSSETDGSDSIHLPLQIYGDSDQFSKLVVIVCARDTLYDLHSILANVARFDDFLLICGGQLLNLHDTPTRQVGEIGLAGKALIVKKKRTLQSIQQERSKRVGKTVHERAILQHFEDLYRCLDDKHEASEQIFWLLTDLQKIAPCHTLSISGGAWNVLYSVHCLSVELHEQISLGVADAAFILKGIHALVQALEQYSSSTNWLMLQFLTATLFEFLQERPVQDLSDQYFIDATQFVRTATSTLNHFARGAQSAGVIARSPDGDISQAALSLYRSVLIAVRLSPEVCKALNEETMFKSIHHDILFNHDQALSGNIAGCIKRFCVEENAPVEIKSLFWTTFLDSIPKAQENPDFCASFYQMAPEVLVTNDKIHCEAELRVMIDNFSTILLGTDHSELFGKTVVDSRIPGLCSLIRGCIDRLKSFKKPLGLGHIGRDVFRKFLFPSNDDYQTNGVPVITAAARHSLYTLVHSTCEDVQTLMQLATLTMHALESCDISDDFIYSGQESFTRSDSGYSGLCNLQQTCYVNSLLQQLYMNLHFRKFILETPVTNESQQVVLHELKRTFASLQDSYSLAYYPESLAKALDVDIEVQDDAQIFFTILIGKLEDSMPHDSAKTHLKSFFRGLNKSQTIGECGHISESPDEYYNLSLVVKDKSSLEESLHEYIQGSPLEGGDKFRCLTCEPKNGGVYVNATRRTGLEQIPDNLVLGLKRFRYESYDGGAKVNDRFDFPERIDMNAYKLQCLTKADQRMEPDVFQLVGVVVHDGTLQSGHYWSYAAERSGPPTSATPWLKLDDRFATRVTIDQVMAETRGGSKGTEKEGQTWLRSDNAYVLFYERLSSVKSANSLIIQQPPAVRSTLGLCPRVSVPEDLAEEIAVENEKHLRMMALYAVEHADFVRGLLMKYELISMGQPSEDNCAEKSLLALTFEHLFQVTIRTQGLDHLDKIMLSLRKLTSAHPDNAVYFCNLLFRQPDLWTYRRFIFHKKAVVRGHAQRLLVACLHSLRESDPDRYGINTQGRIKSDPTTCIKLVLDAHASLTPYLSTHRTSWPEFFDFIANMAAFGPNETALLLDQGHLEFCLEVLFIRVEQGLQSKHSEMWYCMQRNRMYPLHALSRAIYGLLNEHIDLARFTTGRGYKHARGPAESITLSPEEENFINHKNSRGRVILVMSVINSMKDVDDFSSRLAPMKLIALLSDQSKIDMSLQEAVYHTLLGGLRQDATLIYLDAVEYCITNGNMLPRYKYALMEAVAKLPSEFEDMSEGVLQFMTSVYPVEPIVVLQLVPTWADKLLICEDSESEEAALGWLKTYLFCSSSGTEAYKGEGLRHEFQRTMTTKALASVLMHALQLARDDLLDYEDYDRAVLALDACVTWLKHSAQAMNDWLRRSYDTHEETKGLVVEDAESHVTQLAGATISTEDLDEAAIDASEIAEQCEDMFNTLKDWSRGSCGSLAFRDRHENAQGGSTRFSDTEDAGTDGDPAESDGEEGVSEGGWLSEGSLAP